MTLKLAREGLYWLLYTHGPYADFELSTCNYDPLETAAASSIVFAPGPATEFEALTWGPSGTDQANWSIAGTIYIKDTGDPSDVNDKAWTAHDDFYNTIRQDRSLGGRVAYARVTGMSHDAGQFIEEGGALWGMVDWTVEIIDINLDDV